MRYLGKVASILSLRADLEHVHVSIILWWHLQVEWAISELPSSSFSKRHPWQSCLYENDLLFSYKWNHFHKKGFAPCLILKVNFWNSKVAYWEDWTVMKFLIVEDLSCFRSDYNIAIGHAFGFFLQKIAVMEMIIRTVKQLFKVHMQSGEWHKAYFLGHYLHSATKLVETCTVYFALKGLN